MNWLHHVWFTWVYPSLLGNGPEAVVQTIVYGLIAVAVVPVLRHWAERETKKIHAKMDHIIFHHPDIPPMPK